MLLFFLVAWANAQPEINGTVVDPSGAPVAGATVVGTMEYDGGASTFGADELTDEKGAWTYSRVRSSPVQRLRVFAYKKGWSTSDEVTSPPIGAKGYAPVVLRMRPTVTETFAVIDGNTHAPVAGVMVTIDPESFSTEHPEKGVARTTDAKGEVVYTGVNDRDSMRILASKPGYLDTWIDAELTKPRNEIQISLGAKFLARFVDDATGQPIPDLQVAIGYGNDVRTDAEGRASVLVPYGSVIVEPHDPRYGTDYDRFPWSRYETFDLASRDTLHETRLRANSVITGAVVDAEGKPATGILVTLYPQMPANDIRVLHVGPPLERTKTDATGHFRFDTFVCDHYRIELPPNYQLQ